MKDLNQNHLTIKDFPDNSIDWLKRLISFDTTSRISNLALINDVQSFCVTLGLKLHKHLYLTYNQQKNKANLFITVPSGEKSDNFTNNGIVLSGHTDVVPVDGQDWSSDPFHAEIRGDKLFGRGACDMKGFLACALNILPDLVQISQEGKLIRPIHLALSYDEEVGCLGAPVMLKDLENKGVNPEYCIVGEPSDMKMVIAHKGINVFRCRVHGKSAHSSLTPQGVNAISYASRLIGFIDELAEDFKQRSDVDNSYDVPFSTLSVGTIKGGTATNIVPNLCEFTFDYRNLPFMDIQDVLHPIQERIDVLNTKMQAIDTNTGIEIEQLDEVPAMTNQDSKELQILINGLLTSDENSAKKVAYATEGGQFTNAGIATIICGPGSIEQAHKPNEFVMLEQIDKCDQFLQKLLESIQYY